MSDKFTALTPELYKYLIAHTMQPDEVLLELTQKTQTLGNVSRMQIAPDQGALLTLITKILNAELAIEVGTFTGYSAICIARGLKTGGQLICCELNETYADIAKQYFKKADLNERITIKLGPALETLNKLDVQNVDLAFVDADKENYLAYYEMLLPKIGTNGLIIFDNVLWHSSVIDPTANDSSVLAIRKLNDFLIKDRRVDVVMLAIADGMLLVRKR